MKALHSTTVYYTCPCCGDNLDPGEKCNCEKEKAACAETQNGKPQGLISSKNSIPQRLEQCQA
ncbi:MAG: hypothetical protein IJM94_02460 [Clostridia bacterium]|nr:hypothetical protein [Clostridia bacterium]